MLAFPGALFACFFTAILSVYAFDYNWNWATGLMLGSILCTTDPVAVVGLLRDLGQISIISIKRVIRRCNHTDRFFLCPALLSFEGGSLY